MNYIGSKHTLLPEIEDVLAEHEVPRSGVALDLFAGTGAVGRMLKRRGHVVWANDWQFYSYATNSALIEGDGAPGFQNLGGAEAALACLNALPGGAGPFYEHYCEGGVAGRQYFSRSNGLRLQHIRDTIGLWQREGRISQREHLWLIACLIEAADKVANTASVYGAYLKHIKSTAERDLHLTALSSETSCVAGHKAFCMDSLEFVRTLPGPVTLTYIDPPYNSRQYGANYHILETIARWDVDRFSPRGVTGLRPSQRSPYCLTRRVEAAFRELLGALASDYILFSYNNEGLLPEQTLLSLLSEVAEDVHVRRIAFRRFRADLDSENRSYSGDSTEELLILARACSREAARKAPALALAL